MDFHDFPQPPMYNNLQKSYTSDGKPNNVVQQQTPVVNQPNNPFASLIGQKVAPFTQAAPIVTGLPAKETRTKKKKEKNEIVASDKKESDKPANVVEGVIYADTYEETNVLSKQVIQVADAMMAEAKAEYDMIKATPRSSKGRTFNMGRMMDSVVGFLNIKMQGIKEIDANIKNANDAEYRRWKDTRALIQTDDNKAIADSYMAFISQPVGLPQYRLPTTQEITNGEHIVRADLPEDIQREMDSQLASYVSNISPEENLMLHSKGDPHYDPNIEQVMFFDQTTGVKSLLWVDRSNDKPIPNMPLEPESVVADYSVDARSMTASNNHINSTVRVIPVNTDIDKL